MKRVQRKRAKGWKMPENTIYVGRPTKWGNPYKVGGVYFSPDELRGNPFSPRGESIKTIEQCVSLYREYVSNELKYRRLNISELKGKNLACFCPLGSPCHVDVLLEFINNQGNTQ